MSEQVPDGRVLIVDDHLLFATTIELALSRQGLRASCADLEDGDVTALRSTIVADPPDLLLLDLDLGPYGDGRALIGPATGAGVDVLVVTGSVESAEWTRAIEAGATAVLTKTRPLAELIDVVRRMLSGTPLEA